MVGASIIIVGASNSFLVALVVVIAVGAGIVVVVGHGVADDVRATINRLRRCCYCRS